SAAGLVASDCLCELKSCVGGGWSERLGNPSAYSSLCSSDRSGCVLVPHERRAGAGCQDLDRAQVRIESAAEKAYGAVVSGLRGFFKVDLGRSLDVEVPAVTGEPTQKVCGGVEEVIAPCVGGEHSDLERDVPTEAHPASRTAIRHVRSRGDVN